MKNSAFSAFRDSDQVENAPEQDPLQGKPNGRSSRWLAIADASTGSRPVETNPTPVPARHAKRNASPAIQDWLNSTGC
jgi:hypothetical protein